MVKCDKCGKELRQPYSGCCNMGLNLCLKCEIETDKEVDVTERIMKLEGALKEILTLSGVEGTYIEKVCKRALKN